MQQINCTKLIITKKSDLGIEQFSIDKIQGSSVRKGKLTNVIVILKVERKITINCQTTTGDKEIEP